MHHLKMIGGLILMRQAEGNLKRVPGALNGGAELEIGGKSGNVPLRAKEGRS
jgi:hypothetical protein